MEPGKSLGKSLGKKLGGVGIGSGWCGISYKVLTIKFWGISKVKLKHLTSFASVFC